MQDHPIQESLKNISKNYEKLLKKAITKFEEFKDENAPTFHKAIDLVTKDLIKTEDMTLDEARHLAGSLKRDLLDAAHHLSDNKDELKSWLDFDITFIEQSLLSAFLDAADKTTVELAQFQAEAMSANYKTGEVVGISTLKCDNCGELLHFHKPGHIPPCPKCKQTLFHRTTRPD